MNERPLKHIGAFSSRFFFFFFLRVKKQVHHNEGEIYSLSVFKFWGQQDDGGGDIIHLYLHTIHPHDLLSQHVPLSVIMAHQKC